MKTISIYGASGHGKVIIEIAETLGYSIGYVFDDDKSITKLLSYKVTHSPNEHQLLQYPIVFAIGNNKTRQQLAATLHIKTAPPLIHPSAIISPRATIGKGTVVMPGAIINADTVIGDHCIINSGAVVEHDCILEDFVHISPNASLAGGVTVKKEHKWE